MVMGVKVITNSFRARLLSWYDE